MMNPDPFSPVSPNRRRFLKLLGLGGLSAAALPLVRPALADAAGAATGVIFGFDLGVFFSVAMIAIAGGAILYDTSNVLHHYQEDRYVAAALQLFASVALMFWYVLQLFLSLSRN